MDAEAIEKIRQMQFTIDEYKRFIEHIFLLLKVDPNRRMLVGDLPDEGITNEIIIELDRLLIEAGRKKDEC